MVITIRSSVSVKPPRHLTIPSRKKPGRLAFICRFVRSRLFPSKFYGTFAALPPKAGNGTGINAALHVVKLSPLDVAVQHPNISAERKLSFQMRTYVRFVKSSCDGSPVIGITLAVTVLTRTCNRRVRQ